MSQTLSLACSEARDPIADRIAQLVAEAPRFTPAKIARLSLIMNVPVVQAPAVIGRAA